MLTNFPLGPSHEPNNRFSLFHMDRGEIHLDAFAVQIFDPSRNSLESGVLHMCSRSVAFDSHQLATDLLRLRFNANFVFNILQGDILQQAAISTAQNSGMPLESPEMALYTQLNNLLTIQIAQQVGLQPQVLAEKIQIPDQFFVTGSQQYEETAKIQTAKKMLLDTQLLVISVQSETQNLRTQAIAQNLLSEQSNSDPFKGKEEKVCLRMSRIRPGPVRT